MMKTILDKIFGCFKFKTMLRLSIPFLVLFYTSFNLYAAEDQHFWKRIGPEGAIIEHLITNQDYPEIIYATAILGNFNIGAYLKSSNGGQSWVVLPHLKKPRRYFPDSLALDLAVDAVNPHILYTYHSDSLFKSVDNAMHWQLLAGDLNSQASSFFALNPTPVTQSLRILTKTENFVEFGMAISQDGGQQWLPTDARVNLRSDDNTDITIIASDTKHPDILYGVVLWAGDFTPPSPFENILYKSINGGLSWVNITLPTKKYSGGFTIAPDNSEKLYASFDGITMLSNNGGQDWTFLVNPYENQTEFNITRLFIDPTDSRILYATLRAVDFADRVTYASRIAKSYNSGESWQVIDVSPYIPGSEILINAHNKQKLLMTAGRGQGVLRSEDGGENWVPGNTGMNLIGTRSLSVAEDNNAVMYMIDDFNTYYRSTDAGQHWQIFTVAEPVMGECHKFLLNPLQNQEIICQSYAGLFISKDAANHWEVLRAERNAKAMYAQDGMIYTLIAGDIRRSSDAGKTWKVIAPLAYTKPPIFDPVNPGTLYVFASGGIFKSIDRGDSWQLIFVPKTAVFGEWKLFINPHNPENLLFVRGMSNIMLSNDGGKSWEKTLESLLVTDTYSAPQIVFDPNNLNSLFAAIDQGIYQGVYHSSDQGITWDLINKGLEGEDNLLLHTSSGSVFASARTGIFKLSEKTDFSGVSGCLFAWAEKEYPDLFIPGTSSSEQWGGYVYRYYKQSNTYLGFFYAQEVHLKQADSSSKIGVVGSVAFYQELSGCN
ncbi:WD40/YVTN/BNR-like repeat-containing protein [Methyloprofundus sp.]|uniref:WD40/YVTN/BNR-like repeat-containing protein n=1 Tax=Methyloprofundus sp. TaxID=2020875 RepID=UPI003D0EB25D